MSTKIKALSLGLFAVAAMSAFGVMNAVAETGGSFEAHKYPTTITGEENGEHKLDFIADTGGEISCENASYHGELKEASGSLTVAPNWSECFTTGAPETKFEIDENGCDLNFTIHQPESHNTAHFECQDAPLRITHPNCTIDVPSQSVTGVVYTPDEQNGVDSITLDSTVEDITTHYEGKICVLLGTTHTAKMIGSVTVTGEDPGSGEPIGITALGTP